jgi:hypothetical protein
VDHANGGIIRNLSESGIAIQAVGRLHANQTVHLRFDLHKPKVRVDATGEVTWANEFGQAGLRFATLPQRTQRLLKDWLLTDLLAGASELAPSRTPIFAPSSEEDDAVSGLILSPVPVPAIRLVPSEPATPTEEQPQTAVESAAWEMPLRVSWWPTDITPRTLARMVDSLIVIAAVLLFSIVLVETTGTFPSWIVALALGIGVTGVFGFLYRYLFTTFARATPGRRLAQLAAEDMHWSRELETDAPRFR